MPFEAQIRKLVRFYWVDLEIRAQNLATKKIARFVDSKFDVDYDFAVKHDPIQSDD